MPQADPSPLHCLIVSRPVLLWWPTGHGYELQIVPAIVTAYDHDSKQADLYVLAAPGSIKGLHSQELRGVPECDVRGPQARAWSLRADEDPSKIVPFWRAHEGLTWIKGPDPEPENDNPPAIATGG